MNRHKIDADLEDKVAQGLIAHENLKLSGVERVVKLLSDPLAADRSRH